MQPLTIRHRIVPKAFIFPGIKNADSSLTPEAKLVIKAAEEGAKIGGEAGKFVNYVMEGQYLIIDSLIA